LLLLGQGFNDSHSLSVKLLEYGIYFDFSPSQKIPNGFYSVLLVKELLFWGEKVFDLCSNLSMSLKCKVTRVSDRSVVALTIATSCSELNLASDRELDHTLANRFDQSDLVSAKLVVR